MCNIKNSILPNGWLEFSNIDVFSTARIWILWNPKVVSVQNLNTDAQVIHGDINYDSSVFHLSACYGFNNYIQRRDLWKSIVLE